MRKLAKRRFSKEALENLRRTAAYARARKAALRKEIMAKTKNRKQPKAEKVTPILIPPVPPTTTSSDVQTIEHHHTVISFPPKAPHAILVYGRSGAVEIYLIGEEELIPVKFTVLGDK